MYRVQEQDSSPGGKNVPGQGKPGAHRYQIVLPSKHRERLERLKERGEYETWTAVFKDGLKALEEKMER